MKVIKFTAFIAVLLSREIKLWKFQNPKIRKEEETGPELEHIIIVFVQLIY